MTDFFKSALGGMFGNNPAGEDSHANTQSTNSQNNNFVGSNIIIGQHKLKITKLIAEGGFAIVYLAVDITSGEEFALKRIFSADDTANKEIRDEIGFLKKVVNHPNLINFISAACEEKENSRSKEFLILTELCKDPIIDHLRLGLSLPSGRAFDSDQVLQIFYQICRSVQYLHAQDPCIIHRDLKLENFLVSKNWGIKLCDFGSATYEVYRPDNSWSVNKRNLIEDDIAKQTTPMYRAPEMLDLYNNYAIDSKVDIWALGCVLFVLCYNKHPFEDAAKLRIINGKYQIPHNDTEFTDFHDLIRCLLEINPSDRPNINEVMFHLENIAQTKSVNFQENLDFLKKTESVGSNINPINQFMNGNSVPNQQNNKDNSNHGINSNSECHNPVGQSMGQQQGQGGSNWMGNAAGMFKGSSFMSHIKAASNKVIEGVQSMNKGDLDMTYITSRVIVMSCPTDGIESAAFGNNIDLIKEAIEAKHGKTYRIYNLANKTYKKEKFSQVIDLGMQLSANRAPPISLMCKLCQNILKFLNENKDNTCILNCNDGRNISGIAVVTLFMYCSLINNLDACLNFFSAKRGALNLTSMQYNHLKDTQKLFSNARGELNSTYSLVPNECLMSSIIIVGVPLFNRMRNGCTPYIEIYNREKKIYTNIQDYAQIKKYISKEGQIMIPINCHKFYGDTTIMIFHAKSLLGTEKVTSTKICQVQFHTAFISQELIESRQFSFKKETMDGLDSSEKYPDNFQLILNIDLKSNQSPISSDEPWANREQFDSMIPKVPQQILFKEENEMERIIHIFDSASKSYSDEASHQKPSENNNTNFNSYVDNDRQEAVQEPAGFTSYLNVNKFGTDDDNVSSTKSSRSASPSGYDPIQPESQHNKTNTLLLDFDGDSDASSTHNNQEPITTNKSEGLNNDFQLLLDLDDQLPTQENITNTTSQSNNLFDNDFFSSALQPQPPQATVTKPNNLDDIFGSLNQPITNPTSISKKSKNAFDLFDLNPMNNTPLGSAKNNSYNNLLGMNQNKSSGSNRVTPTDPFSDLSAFGNLGNSNSTSTSQNNLNTNNNQTNRTQTTSNINNNANFNFGNSGFTESSSSTNNKANYYIPTNSSNPSNSTSANNNNSNNSNLSSQQYTKPAPPPSNYGNNSNNFNFMTSAAGSNASSAFDDFLPSSFSTNKEKANMSLKAMQREVTAIDVDPNKLKVMEWTDGKKANIRALLCSLNKVLWEGEKKWKPCGMHQLVSANDVKKMYRNAVLCVHPDKLTDHPEVELARLIFVELNDAWAQFNNEGQKNLF